MEDNESEFMQFWEALGPINSFTQPPEGSGNDTIYGVMMSQ